jgi:hypothetical protein
MMRLLLAGAISGGGLVTTAAFFLPWVVVSCSGTHLGTVSPWERATGIEVGSRVDLDDAVSPGDETPAPRLAAERRDATGATNDAGLKLRDPDLAPDRRYFILLVAPILLVAFGALIAVAQFVPVRLVGATSALFALGLLVAIVFLGYEHRLGLSGMSSPGAGLDLRTEPSWGLWLAIAGAALSTAAGLVAVVRPGASIVPLPKRSGGAGSTTV